MEAVFANLDDCWNGAGKAGTYGVACSGAMTADSSAKQQMVFNGHDHFYQRHKPLHNDNVVDNLHGRHYIVTAGAGASLYDVKTGGTVAVTKSAIHYVVVRLFGNSLEMKSIELHPTSGQTVGVIDSLSFTR